MNHAKMVALLKRLLQQTVDGKLEWEETERADTYQVAFPDYSVQTTLCPESRDRPAYLRLAIFNAAGRMLEEMTDEDIMSEMEKPFQTMLDLHERARQKAMGVDEALDKLLAELDKM